MKEHRRIVSRWHAGAASVLVTLTGVQGSSYRQPGAHLLLAPDGTYEGAISAGCLEADLLRKAAWLTRNGPVLERYSTLFDQTAVDADTMPFGLGCGGVLDLLLEPVATPECQALLGAIEATLSGTAHLVATWLPHPDRPLARAIFRSDGHLVFASSSIAAPDLARVRAAALQTAPTDLPGLSLERLLPPQRLFLFGAGDDAQPLVTMAGLLGWSVTVADGRPHLASRTRFPDPAVVVTSAPSTAIAQVTARDAVVLMSHSYAQDRDFLTAVLPARPRYLGLLGSRQRSALLIAEAAATLDLPISECASLICAPVGLDIGGEGSEAIALAVLAEAQACCAGKGSTSRKLSAEHIQHLLTENDAHPYLETRCALDLP